MTAPVMIAIGASAGGVEALVHLVSTLPPDLPAAIGVVVHIPFNVTSLLPHILSRAGRLPATHPADRETLEPGHIYVAPPNHHLLVENQQLVLTRGPRENSHRPAIDPLFRTAARAFGPRTIGVILSGALDDGSAGLRRIKASRGIAIVQDPEDAFHPDMPRNAIENVAVDHILPVAEIGEQLARLARALAQAQLEGAKTMAEERDDVEEAIVQADKAALERGERSDETTIFTCPDCGGAIWELDEGETLRFRCHVGHAYSAESFLNGQAEALEAALWTAVRTLEEKASLSRRLAERARQGGRARSEKIFEDQEREAEQQATLVRQAILLGEAPISDRAETPNPAKPRRARLKPKTNGSSAKRKPANASRK